MKLYYYSENNQQLGPYTLDELKVKRLKKSTLVWTEGLEEWTAADKIEELKDILISEPPPLPIKKASEPDAKVTLSLITPSTKSDQERETTATLIGILFLLTPIILKFTGAFNFEYEESYNQARIFLTISSLVLRIVVTAWVVVIANRLNRNPNGWGLFSFFLPSLALIVIGLQSKLPLRINLDRSLSIDEQIIILKQKAEKLKSDLRFNDALVLFSKIKEMNIGYPMIDEEIKFCKERTQLDSTLKYDLENPKVYTGFYTNK